MSREDEESAPSSEVHKAFLGGLSWETTEEGLVMYFESITGPGRVVSATIMRDRYTGQPRGFGFVTFGAKADLLDVCDRKEHVIDGKDVEVKMAIGRHRDREGEAAAAEERRNAPTTQADFANPEKKLFVGGLLPETKEEDLIEYFKQYGEIKGAVIKYDAESHRSRGFGFVTFEDVESIDRAYEAGRHHQVLGKRVEIKKYQRSSAGPAQNAGPGGTAQGAQPSTGTKNGLDPALRDRLERPLKKYATRTFSDVYCEFYEAEGGRGGGPGRDRRGDGRGDLRDRDDHSRGGGPRGGGGGRRGRRR